MITYKTVEEVTGVGYEYYRDIQGWERWLLDGEYHREGGPAVKTSKGTEVWYYLNGKLHRPDGPAVIRENGSHGYWLEGTELEPDQIETMKHLLTCDLSELPLYINTEYKSVVEWRLKQNDHDRTQNPNQVPG